VFTVTTVWAQENNQNIANGSTPSPNFPGSLVFEYGLNYLSNPTHEMRSKAGKSSTFNIYYLYPVQINNSRFSFVPGIGIGTEKFGFEDAVTLLDSSNFTLLKNITDLPRFADLDNFRHSQMISHYLDIPLELRVHARKGDNKRGWFLAVGGKVGLNIGTKTKIIYSEFGTEKTYIDKHKFNVNGFRYGLVARIGVGPFSVWSYYSASTVFKADKALHINNPNMWSFGMTLATF